MTGDIRVQPQPAPLTLSNNDVEILQRARASLMKIVTELTDSDACLNGEDTVHDIIGDVFELRRKFTHLFLTGTRIGK